MTNQVQGSNEAPIWGINTSNTIKSLTYNGKQCEIVTLKSSSPSKNSPFGAQDVRDIAAFLMGNKQILQDQQVITVNLADGRNFEVSFKGQNTTQDKTDSVMQKARLQDSDTGKTVRGRIRDAAVSVKEGIKDLWKSTSDSRRNVSHWLKNKQVEAADKGVETAQKKLDNYKGNSYTKRDILEAKLELAKTKRKVATPGFDQERAKILTKEAKADVRAAIRAHYTPDKSTYTPL
ncbi:MAG: hypothetical protein LLF94_02285 [Chlamydiales bacterium]|nr:hypothetical protein [Chlamydiales bacterium]